MKNEYAIPLVIIISVAVTYLSVELGTSSANRQEEIRERYKAGYYHEPYLWKDETATRDWNSYRFKNAFRIKVPHTMELKEDSKIYPPNAHDYLNREFRIKDTPITFSQKGLKEREPTAFDTYCRIIIDVEEGKRGDYLKPDEKEKLSMEDIRALQRSVNAGKYRIIGDPNVCWSKIGSIYALTIEYIREGEEGYRTKVRNYQLFNDDKVVTISLSHHLEDVDKWEDDLTKSISSFEWIN